VVIFGETFPCSLYEEFAPSGTLKSLELCSVSVFIIVLVLFGGAIQVKHWRSNYSRSFNSRTVFRRYTKLIKIYKNLEWIRK